MFNTVIIYLSKFLSKLIKALNLGNGSTWPGHIALAINRDFIPDIIKNSKVKIIFVAGTNGKTTTASMIRTVLESNRKKVILNESGANLSNGIASSLLINTNYVGKLNHDYALFEVDENSLPLILKEITPDYLIVNNLFRDQLDRYGEVNTIAQKWNEAFHLLPKQTTLILNADDPQIAFLGKNLQTKTKYFGIKSESKESKNIILEDSSDSLYCPNCGNKLKYKSVIFSHLGDWSCPSCNLRKPETDISNFLYFPLAGTYNIYNTLAAVLLLSQVGLSEKEIISGLHNFKPAFGRQEIIVFEDKKIQILLSKNPTGFNQSLRTITEMKAKTVLLVLNDKIADGKDVSWIWDIDFEKYSFENIIISGQRMYDMALRVKYAITNEKTKINAIENLQEAIKEGLNFQSQNDTLYILPTYTAMLEVRKILTGKKIL